MSPGVPVSSRASKRANWVLLELQKGIDEEILIIRLAANGILRELRLIREVRLFQLENHRVAEHQFSQRLHLGRQCCRLERLHGGGGGSRRELERSSEGERVHPLLSHMPPILP